MTFQDLISACLTEVDPQAKLDLYLETNTVQCFEFEPSKSWCYVAQKWFDSIENSLDTDGDQAVMLLDFDVQNGIYLRKYLFSSYGEDQTIQLLVSMSSVTITLL